MSNKHCSLTVPSRQACNVLRHQRALLKGLATQVGRCSGTSSVTAAQQQQLQQHQSAPPVWVEAEYSSIWHGQPRRDEYHWITKLGPAHPQVLKNLKAESQHTIKCLASTRQLQLGLQASMNSWVNAAVSLGCDLQQALESGANSLHNQAQNWQQRILHQQQQQGNERCPPEQQRQQQQQWVQADCLAGRGWLLYQQRNSFGWPGIRIGAYQFFSLPAVQPTDGLAAAGPLLHCRVAADAANRQAVNTVPAAAAAVVSGVDGARANYVLQQLPSGTLVLWDESDLGLHSSGNSSNGADSSAISNGHSTGSSSSNAIQPSASFIHSLAVSACGTFLAITHSRTSNAKAKYTLTIVSCCTGAAVMHPLAAVDGPVQWLLPATHMQERDQQPGSDVQHVRAKQTPQGIKLAQQQQRQPEAHMQRSSKQLDLGSQHARDQQPAAYKQQGAKPAAQQQQCLVYVAGDFTRVHVLPVAVSAATHQHSSVGGNMAGSIGSTHNNAASKANSNSTAANTASITDNDASTIAASNLALTQLPRPSSVIAYSDPHSVSLNIAQAGSISLILVYAADGLVRQVLYHSWAHAAPNEVDNMQLVNNSVSSNDNINSSNSNSRSSSSSCDAACPLGSWRLLLPSATAAALTASNGGDNPSTSGTAAAAFAPSVSSEVGVRTMATNASRGTDSFGYVSTVEGDDDPSMRLAVAAVNNWMFVRRSSAHHPLGQLFAAQVQPLQQQQQQKEGLQWHLLLQEQDNFCMKAVFAHSQNWNHSMQSSRQAAPLRIQLIVLGMRQHMFALEPQQIPIDEQLPQQQQQQTLRHSQQRRQQHSKPGASLHTQRLEARCYSLQLPAGAVFSKPLEQPQQQPQHCPKPTLQYTCTLPVPDASYSINGGSYCPDTGELKLVFSSLVRPVSQLTINLEQLAKQQQQSQQQRSGQIQLERQYQTQQIIMQQQQQQQDLSTPQHRLDNRPGSNQPQSALAVDVVKLQRLQPALEEYDQSQYATLQLAVPAVDGKIVPLSLAFNRHKVQLPSSFQAGFKLQQQIQTVQWHSSNVGSSTPESQSTISNGANKIYNDAVSRSVGQPTQQQMLLTCYGSYAIREDTCFHSEALQLLDQGWIVGVAHVRGGGWLGMAWAEVGRGAGKADSITDLLAVAGYVQEVGLCSRGCLCVEGSSAGGWLACSAMLQQPGLFAAAVLTVPCLDPLGLLLGTDQLVLELGPAATDEQVYYNIRSWAPYDVLEVLLYSEPALIQQQPHIGQQCTLQQQTQPQAACTVDAGAAAKLTNMVKLPHILVRAALHDYSVPLDNPVKVLARLRRLQQQLQQLQQLQKSGTAEGCQPDSCSDVQLQCAFAIEPQLLLRVVPGDHKAFKNDVKESALKLAFLLTATASS